MTNTNVMEQKKEMTNGVDIGQIMDVIGAIEADPGYAKFQWRATNRWINGGNAGDTTRKEAFTLDADEPAIAAGQNSAPNSMEYVLHALATCLTGRPAPFLAHHRALCLRARKHTHRFLGIRGPQEKKHWKSSLDGRVPPRQDETG